MPDEITNEIDKLSAFIEPAPTVAGLTLRPFTAASLIILRKTGNALLNGSEENVEFDVAAFLYAHSGDTKQVRKTAQDAGAWQDAVINFAETLSIKDFVKAAGDIKGIMERAMVGQDYEVQQDNHDPN